MERSEEVISRHPYLNYHEQRILSDIVRLVQSSYPFIRKVILYGSKARGDFHEESDLDLLFVTEEVLPRSLKFEIYDSIFELEVRYSVTVSVIFVKEIDFQVKDTGFIKRIRKEGILLWLKG